MIRAFPTSSMLRPSSLWPELEISFGPSSNEGVHSLSAYPSKPMKRLSLLLLGLTLSLSACDQAAPLDSAAPIAGPNASATTTPSVTQAPDLATVGNIREGEDANGTSADDTDTYVDFTFDEEASIVSCCSRFQVIPADGGAPLTAITVVDQGTAATTFTAVFEEAFTAADIARGTVDDGIVQSTATGVTNPPQAAPVGDGQGITANPDLISVTQDGDQMIFEFDEPIDRDDDVIQNTSGLRFFTANGDTYNSSVVRTVGGSSTKLRAIYDLPEGVTLDDAVGGFVVAGTVVGDEPNANDLNELDEAAPIIVEAPLAAVCPAAPQTGEVGDESGPTEAPDLLAVDNFRRGPFTADFEATTCVDFVFDQGAYLKGSLSDFNLVPLSGGDALPGSTNQVAEDDQEGDVVVTVIFPGDLSPEDYARGFVDTGVVNSAEGSPTADNPTNINQAANVPPNVLTENPDLEQDLEAVERQSSVWLYFVFDEPLTDDDIVRNTSGLQVYFPSTSQGATIPSAGAVKVKRVNETTLRAKFKDLPEGYKLSDAVGAFVDQGSVQAAPGSQGGNDGTNAFDETFLNVTFPGGS